MNLTKKQEQSKQEIRMILLISKNCYEIFNEFSLLRSPNIVGLEQAEVNVKIYKDFGNMFLSFEEATLCTFSVIFRQLFDSRKDSTSLYLLDFEFKSDLRNEIDDLKNNKEIQMIIDLRHKFFAHKDNSGKHIQRIVPSDEAVKNIYDEILRLFNKITGDVIILHTPSQDELGGLFFVIQKSNPSRFFIKHKN